MVQPPTRIDQKVAYKLLSSEGTFATTLHYILLITFQDEVYELPPAELFNRLEELYNVKLPQEAEDRINAILTLMLTNGYYQDPGTCRAVTLAFADGDPGFELLQSDPTVPEVIWAAYEASLNREALEYGPRVRSWMDHLESNHGWDLQDGLEEVPEEADVAVWLDTQDQALAAQLEELGIPPSARPPLGAFLEGPNTPFGRVPAGVQ